MNARIERTDAGAIIHGDMTLENATALFAAGVGAVKQGTTHFDLSGVGAIDSSGLAVLFGWLRTAQAEGRKVTIAHPPPSLRSLAEVYGVVDLLPLS
ncbi:MAG: STAS domain-containing protein [Rhodocyclaceae bacterium]|jgi:phospholipid transport system transporter-binding protein|uniref:STAS domain-containing protein n=1 Tax=Sulfuricystis thermophila TaxID=2496847 RepID=UPI0024DFA312|nr:STAS domain-containing protein [Sulfuricystis thermophila]MDI6751048.1 STAS domain-containing protein [Rhodocyclaceae bacterium]